MNKIDILFTFINHFIFIFVFIFLFKKKIFPFLKKAQREDKHNAHLMRLEVENEKNKYMQAQECLQRKNEKLTRYVQLVKNWRLKEEKENLLKKQEAERVLFLIKNRQISVENTAVKDAHIEEIKAVFKQEIIDSIKNEQNSDELYIKKWILK